MQGKAKILGHPIHLMLVSFPVAFWTGTLVTDAIGAVTHASFWFAMSVAMLVMGDIAGAASSIAGYIDERTMPLGARARSAVAAHRWWSLASLLACTIAAAVRFEHWASPVGVALTVLGDVLLLIGAYIGSGLVVRFGLGVPAALFDRDALGGQIHDEIDR